MSSKFRSSTATSDETCVGPKLRFPEFRDAGKWKKKAVGDVFKVTRGEVLSMTLVNDAPTAEAPYPVYSSQTKNHGLAGYYSRFLYQDAITWTTDGANAGDVNFRSGQFFCTNVCGVLISKDGHANACVAELLNSVTRSHVSYVGNPKLMNGVMAGIEIPFPAIPEQQRIADCLDSADALIEAQGRKVETLRAHKKGLMQQLFPQEGETQPHLRFPEFQDAKEWQVTKLNSLLFEAKQRNRSLELGPVDVLSVSGDHGCVNQIEFMGRSYAGVTVKDYHVVENGDIVYTKSPLKKNPYGIIKENKGKRGIVSTLYAVYRPFPHCSAAYLDHFFSVYYNVNVYLQPIVKKGAKNDMKVNNADVLKGNICVPPLPEQQKIADCLTSLDDLIAAETRKLDTLKTHKKGLMQQLFPSVGGADA